jgi:hypothetical protein
VKTGAAKKQEKQSMEARTQNAAPVLTTIGIDIRKNFFHIVGFDADGKIALRRKIKRSALAETFKSCLLVSWVWRPASAHISLARCYGRSHMNHGGLVVIAMTPLLLLLPKRQSEQFAAVLVAFIGAIYAGFGLQSGTRTQIVIEWTVDGRCPATTLIRDLKRFMTCAQVKTLDESSCTGRRGAGPLHRNTRCGTSSVLLLARGLIGRQFRYLNIAAAGFRSSSHLSNPDIWWLIGRTLSYCGRPPA